MSYDSDMGNEIKNFLTNPFGLSATKRKFNVARLYKVAIYIVIAFVAIRLFYGVKYYYEVNYGSRTYAAIDEICVSVAGVLKNPSYILNCKNDFLKEQAAYIEAYQNNFTIIAIVLVLFFGGTWLYKYVFPVKHEK